MQKIKSFFNRIIIYVLKRYSSFSDFGFEILCRFHYTRYLKKHIKEPIQNLPFEVSEKAIGDVWSQYCKVDARWAQYYFVMNKLASPMYVPSDIWFGLICRKLNRLLMFKYPALQDKNYLDKIFGDSVLCPEIIFRNINGEIVDGAFNQISLEDALNICKKYHEIIIKPSIESKGAKNISFITQTGSLERYENELRSIIGKMKSDYVVQNVLKQHKDMARLNPDSINTIRVLSLLWKGKVHILGSLVRIGIRGVRVDNPKASNGVSCVISENGKLHKYAYDREWNPHTELPNGMVLEGYQVPSYKQIIEIVNKLHYKVPHSRIVGWDMTVSEDGVPILIEANMDFPEIYFHQLGAGPIFKDAALFDEILSYVTKK